MDRNDGGPAFPVRSVPYAEGGTFHSPGMTLRDWFAGQAINGICSNVDISKHAFDQVAFANATYATAAAMLKARADG